jgi:hypothetical protein
VIQAAQELHRVARRDGEAGADQRHGAAPDGTAITESINMGQLTSRGGFTVVLVRKRRATGTSSAITETGWNLRCRTRPASNHRGSSPRRCRPDTVVATLSTPIQEFARVPLLVDGEDISNIAVTTQKGATLRGQVIFDIGAPPADADPNVLRVTPYYTTSAQPISTGTTTMHEDWTFEIDGVVATGLLRLSSTTTGWSTKLVVIEGRMSPKPRWISIRARISTSSDVDPKRAEVNGTVVDAQNRATKEFVACSFPKSLSGGFRVTVRFLRVAGTRTVSSGLRRCLRAGFSSPPSRHSRRARNRIRSSLAASRTARPGSCSTKDRRRR